eukprot:TRINITY_DN8298_c0_g1_i2.p1 TRINITY_DN8298_c0_g1~~TRINITY_DN8298_c0_g1_i2.p1  ORF type:complete len:807 (+),score=107.43 TRINITY_DN8298_c0_g1_i2:112-2532(+)
MTVPRVEKLPDVPKRQPPLGHGPRAVLTAAHRPPSLLTLSAPPPPPCVEQPLDCNEQDETSSCAATLKRGGVEKPLMSDAPERTFDELLLAVIDSYKKLENKVEEVTAENTRLCRRLRIARNNDMRFSKCMADSLEKPEEETCFSEKGREIFSEKGREVLEDCDVSNCSPSTVDKSLDDGWCEPIVHEEVRDISRLRKLYFAERSPTENWAVFLVGIVEKEFLTRFPARDIWTAALKKNKVPFGNEMVHFLESSNRLGVCPKKRSTVIRELLDPTKQWCCSRRRSPSMESIMMHPHSTRRLLWLSIGMLLLLYDSLKLTLTVFDLDENWLTVAVDMIGNLYWSLDIPISFLTATFSQGKLWTSPKKVATVYIQSWFFFDVFVVAAQWMLVFFESDRNLSSMSALRYVRFLRFSRLVRMVKILIMLPALLAAISSPFYLLGAEILQFLMGMMIWIHLSACGFFYVEGGHDARNEKFAGAASVQLKYITAAHWAVAQLQGSTDINPGNLFAQRLYSVSVSMISIPVCALFISRLTNILMELHELTKCNAAQSRRVRDYVNRHGISYDLSIRVQKFVKWKQTVQKNRTEKADEVVLNLLPKSLKGALLEETHTPLLIQHCIFHKLRSDFRPFFQCVCVEALNPILLLPDEQLFHVCSVPSHAFMVESGDIVFFHYGAIARSMLICATSGARTQGADHLRDRLLRPTGIEPGKIVSEMALWTICTHSGDLRAVSQSSVLAISVGKIEETAVGFPVLHMLLATHALHFAQGLNSTNGCEPDLYSSFDLQNEQTARHTKHFVQSMTLDSCDE